MKVLFKGIIATLCFHQYEPVVTQLHIIPSHNNISLLFKICYSHIILIILSKYMIVIVQNVNYYFSCLE